MRIPQPKTNVNWYDFVKATPGERDTVVVLSSIYCTYLCALFYYNAFPMSQAWAKKLEGELALGKTLVTFQALSPISDESASCSFTIHVRDTVPPRVYNCPKDFRAYLDEGQVKRQARPFLS